LAGPFRCNERQLTYCFRRTFDGWAQPDGPRRRGAHEGLAKGRDFASPRSSASGTAPDALRRNEIAAIQGDRVYQRHTFDVPFFSRPTNFPRGPFLLSQVSGAPVLPVFVIRRGWLRYHTLMGDLIPAVPSRVTCGDDDAALYEAMCQAVGFLEKTLTTHYDQWMNFFDFWPVASRD